MCDQVFLRRPGWLRIGNADSSCGSGRPRMPLNCAGEIATAPRPKPWPSSRSTMSPPNECPIRIGLAGSPAMISA